MRKVECGGHEVRGVQCGPCGVRVRGGVERAMWEMSGMWTVPGVSCVVGGGVWGAGCRVWGAAPLAPSPSGKVRSRRPCYISFVSVRGCTLWRMAMRPNVSNCRRKLLMCVLYIYMCEQQMGVCPNYPARGGPSSQGV